MHVTVDRDKCIGAGQCVVRASRVFDQRDEDGLSDVLQPTPAPEDEDAVRDAARNCPSGAIAVTDD